MIRLFLMVALASVAVSSPGWSKTKYSTAQLCQIVHPCLPPAEFARGPFLAKPLIKKMALREVQAVCGVPVADIGGTTPAGRIHAAMAAGGAGALGCAQISADVCTVHVASDLQAAIPELYRLILHHELAHCRGWVH